MNRKMNWAPIGAVLTVGAVCLVFALSIVRKFSYRGVPGFSSELARASWTKFP
jgi:hypothetical protein